MKRDLLHPEDEALHQHFAALTVPPEQQRRMERAIAANLALDRRSLMGEWLSLFAGAPLQHGFYMAAAAAALLLITPLGGILVAVLRAL